MMLPPHTHTRQVVTHELQNSPLTWLTSEEATGPQELGARGGAGPARELQAPPGSVSCYVHIKASGAWTQRVIQAMAGGTPQQVVVGGGGG